MKENLDAEQSLEKILSYLDNNHRSVYYVPSTKYSDVKVQSLQDFIYDFRTTRSDILLLLVKKQGHLDMIGVSRFARSLKYDEDLTIFETVQLDAEDVFSLTTSGNYKIFLKMKERFGVAIVKAIIEESISLGRIIPDCHDIVMFLYRTKWNSIEQQNFYIHCYLQDFTPEELLRFKDLILTHESEERKQGPYYQNMIDYLDGKLAS